MKFLWIAEVEPDPDAGASGTEVATVAALRDLGCEVETVWAVDVPRRIQHGNLHYLLESPREILRVGAARLQAAAQDAVIFNQPHGYRLARWLRANHPHVPSVHKSHGLETHRADVLRRWGVGGAQGGPLRQVASRLLGSLLARHVTLTARYASGHIVSCTGCARYLEGEHGVAADRVAVIPQAAPEEFLRSAPAAWTQARQHKFLYVGQYAPFKGGDVLVAAWERISSARNDVTLTWVCGSQHHHQAAQALSAEGRSRVTFLPWMSQKELRHVYDAHGIFLWPSYVEGFGKAFLEAMARGLCVISTEQGGAADLIDSGSNGFLVPVGDSGSLAARALDMVGACNAKDVAAAAACKAREYSWSRAADSVLAAVQKWKPS